MNVSRTIVNNGAAIAVFLAFAAVMFQPLIAVDSRWILTIICGFVLGASLNHLRMEANRE
jgi:hypothetical protein